MNVLDINENKKQILSTKAASKSVPSLLLSLSPKNNHKNPEISKNINSEINNPYERLKLIQEKIDNKNTELKKIKNKIIDIEHKEKIIEQRKNELKQESLPLLERFKLFEDNKLKKKLNLQNISLNEKIRKISEKVDKIESELLYGNNPGLKDKLKEILDKKDTYLLKINENNNEIEKINDKDKINKYKLNKQFFLFNLDKNNSRNTHREEKLFYLKKYYLSENDIIKENANENYHRCLYEEEIEKKMNEEKIKKKKYEEMRNTEKKIVQKRKIVNFNFHKNIMNRNWINVFINNKKYLSWDEKEKERIKNEENLILLSNNQRKDMNKSITNEELNEFSIKVKNDEIKKNFELKTKKKQLQELWKERKEQLPRYKSKFLMINIQNDNKLKNDIILKKEKIKEKMNERLNFSSEIAKKFRPKLTDEKLKKERIKKINELNGKNKQKNIKELCNKLKMKSIKIVNSQPKNFKKKNVFKTSKSVIEQQILKLQNYKKIESNDNNKKDNINFINSEYAPNEKFNSEENIIKNGIINNKYKTINKTKENSKNFNSKINIFNNTIRQLNKEKEYKQYINHIKYKLKLLNHLIGE